MHAPPPRITAIGQDSLGTGDVGQATADRRVRGNGAARRSLVDFALRIRCGRQQRQRRHDGQPPSDDHDVPPPLKDAKEVRVMSE